MSQACWPRPILGIAAILSASACVTPGGTGSASLEEALLDNQVHGFAMAYCLRSLDNKRLPEPEARVIREQGGRWSQIVVERSRGDFTKFFAILPALDAALAATPMALVRDEGTGGSATVPVYYCAELLRQPAVVGAMGKARAALAPDYTGN